LEIYEEARRIKQEQVCTQINGVLRSWLQSISEEDSYSSLLVVLRESMNGANLPALRCATFILLRDCADHLVACPPKVFKELLPEILKIAGVISIPTKQQVSTEKKDVMNGIDSELHQMAFVAAIHLCLSSHEHVYIILANLLKDLHLRSSTQIKFILQLANRTDNDELRKICIDLLSNADPQTPDARASLAMGQSSKIPEIALAAGDALNKHRKIK
jgi:hypothetical protein